MNRQYTPIPKTITDRIPELAFSEEKIPFDIRTQPFDDFDDGQMFAMEVWTEPQIVKPADKRQKPYAEANLTTYFFNGEGELVSETTQRTRYRG